MGFYLPTDLIVQSSLHLLQPSPAWPLRILINLCQKRIQYLMLYLLAFQIRTYSRLYLILGHLLMRVRELSVFDDPEKTALGGGVANNDLFVCMRP